MYITFACCAGSCHALHVPANVEKIHELLFVFVILLACERPSCTINRRSRLPYTVAWSVYCPLAYFALIGAAPTCNLRHSLQAELCPANIYASKLVNEALLLWPTQREQSNIRLASPEKNVRKRSCKDPIPAHFVSLAQELLACAGRRQTTLLASLGRLAAAKQIATRYNE